MVNPLVIGRLSLVVRESRLLTTNDQRRSTIGCYFAPVLPTFFFNRSPAYRTPLFLYGSGGRSDRISAATWPTFWRSIPFSVSFVSFASTAQSTPVGSGYSIGWEEPKLNTTIPLPFISARKPLPTLPRSLVQPCVTPSNAVVT